MGELRHEAAESRVDPSNVRAAQSWDGPTGDLWAVEAESFDAAVAGYLPGFLAAAAIGLRAHVLDVGCGAGLTTREAARLASAGSVLGVDLSSRMLGLARRRAASAGLTNIRFEQSDAQVADLGTARFDRIISRNGVMFFGDPVAAFANLARALRPDGRMVLSVWQPLRENEWFTAFLDALFVGRRTPRPPRQAGTPGPFSLGDAERIRAVLTSAGFDEPALAEARAPMVFGSDVAAAEVLAQGMFTDLFTDDLADLDECARAEAMAALRASLLAHLGTHGVTYPSATWIVTAQLT